MPNSPRTSFSVTNENVTTVGPTLGVGYAIARTIKGEFFNPSVLVKSLNQFKEIYGSEIVPDNSPSNIERALSKGAQIRVCRVGHLVDGKVDAVKGTLVTGKLQGSVITGTSGKTLDITLSGYSEDTITIKLKFETKEYGGDIFSTNGKFTDVFSKVGSRVMSTLYNTNVNANLTPSFQINQQVVINYVDGDVNKPLFFDINIFKNFLNNNEYLRGSLVEVYEGSVKSDVIVTLDDVYSLLNKAQSVNNTKISITDSNDTPVTLSTSQKLFYYGTVGNSGTVPVADDWKEAGDYIRDYSDFYSVFASHLQQHLQSTDVMAVHQALYTIVESSKNSVYYIEIPKTQTNKTSIISYRQEVGISSNKVAYFAGGLKLYNNDGELVDSDVLGTVMELDANSAKEFGPWYSFAGQNRGLVNDAHGPVALNYGSDGRYEDLNEIAQESINIFVIKDIASGGKATMLWHNFTSALLSNSERFLNVERCILYIKKTLRPILDRYLEEPNNFSTWSKMYLEIEPKLIDLQNRNGISEFDWMGDQYATSFDDLQVNNEADVRSGKYKAILKIKEVVSLQEIDININLDSSNNTVTIQ